MCYGGDFGEDLEWLARTRDLTTDEVVRLHAGALYRVYMIGFMPGFAYLGGLPEELHTPRRENPRTHVPAGSVALGGIQSAIFSIAAPSGWHMLGRTPARGFDLRREPPFLIDAGDLVRFKPISADAFARLDEMAERGEAVAEFTEVGLMAALVARDPGPFATIQDLGRYGYQRFGVSVSGAMDECALRIANMLVGNSQGAAAIEFTLVGGIYEVEAETCRIAMSPAASSR